MGLYARASKAKGRCDRCGFTRLLSTLQPEVVDGRKTGARVCQDCLDPDHPLWRRGRIPVDDPQTLYDPRPDADRAQVASYFGWDPIGGIGLRLSIELGQVTIVVGG